MVGLGFGGGDCLGFGAFFASRSVGCVDDRRRSALPWLGLLGFGGEEDSPLRRRERREDFGGGRCWK